MSLQFDLEQKIMEAWHVVDDVKLLCENVCDRNMSPDEIAKVLIGIEAIYQMRFDSLFRTFEEFLKNQYTKEVFSDL